MSGMSFIPGAVGPSVAQQRSDPRLDHEYIAPLSMTDDGYAITIVDLLVEEFSKGHSSSPVEVFKRHRNHFTFPQSTEGVSEPIYPNRTAAMVACKVCVEIAMFRIRTAMAAMDQSEIANHVSISLHRYNAAIGHVLQMFHSSRDAYTLTTLGKLFRDLTDDYMNLIGNPVDKGTQKIAVEGKVAHAHLHAAAAAPGAGSPYAGFGDMGTLIQHQELGSVDVNASNYTELVEDEG